MRRTKCTARALRIRRHRRVRAKLAGTASRPRLAVFRSNAYIYAQLIDDATGHTLAAASDLGTERASMDRTARAEAIGKLVAERAQALGITAVVFDRGGRRYHGRVKALAEAARSAGLKF